MPPAAPGIAVAASSPGKSEIIASVVSGKPAIEAAFCNAARIYSDSSQSGAVAPLFKMIRFSAL